MKKSIFLILLVASQANASEWIKIANTDTNNYYSTAEAVSIHSMNINTLIKGQNVATGATNIFNIVFKCDEWKASIVDYEPVYLNKSLTTFTLPKPSDLDIQKGTVIADMFNIFCSLLYKEEQ